MGWLPPPCAALAYPVASRAPLCCVSLQSLLPLVLKAGRTFPVKILTTILGFRAAALDILKLPHPASLREHCDTETSRPPPAALGFSLWAGVWGSPGPPWCWGNLFLSAVLPNPPPIFPLLSCCCQAPGPLLSPPCAGWVIRGPCASVWEILSLCHLALVPSYGGFWGHH